MDLGQVMLANRLEYMPVLFWLVPELDLWLTAGVTASPESRATISKEMAGRNRRLSELMAAESETPVRRARGGKQLCFRVVAVLLGLVVTLIVVEVFLRIRTQRSQASGVYDPPNLFRYDPRLGWALTPGWRGTHRHYDYLASYTINNLGFRNDLGFPGQRRGKLHAVLGDSFTFGLGVNDAETFVHRLDESGANTFLNFAIPGYSTDQETLLLEQEILGLKPDVVHLVVYLGNDLFDNQLPFPLQASRGKPCAELGATGLVFKNIPVPLRTKSADEAAVTLGTFIGGLNSHRRDLRGRLERASATFALLSEQVFPRHLDERSFAGKFDAQVDLFFAIVDRIRTNCAAQSASLNLILMAGRSYVEAPTSDSAQFQAHLRREIVSRADASGLKVTDLASALRLAYAKSPGKWYYPNEGHLTPAGHQVVAQLLTGKLD